MTIFMIVSFLVRLPFLIILAVITRVAVLTAKLSTYFTYILIITLPRNKESHYETENNEIKSQSDA